MPESLFDAAEAAKWLVEALESGHPLAPLPPGLAPADGIDGAEIAASVLEATGQTACGIRILRRPGQPSVPGPVVETRLLPSGASIALGMLRHPRATAAIIGVLAEDLEADATVPPVLARLHPALDIAATRFTNPPGDLPNLMADLGSLGLLVAGKARTLPAATLAVSLGAPESRRRGAATDIAAAFAEAAECARSLGGLPAGAILVVAGLSDPVEPGPGLALASRLTGLGKAEARFV